MAARRNRAEDVVQAHAGADQDAVLVEATLLREGWRDDRMLQRAALECPVDQRGYRAAQGGVDLHEQPRVRVEGRGGGGHAAASFSRRRVPQIQVDGQDLQVFGPGGW